MLRAPVVDDSVVCESTEETLAETVSVTLREQSESPPKRRDSAVRPATVVVCRLPRSHLASLKGVPHARGVDPSRQLGRPASLAMTDVRSCGSTGFGRWT